MKKMPSRFNIVRRGWKSEKREIRGESDRINITGTGCGVKYRRDSYYYTRFKRSEADRWDIRDGDGRRLL